jgi:hypothetical protein
MAVLLIGWDHEGNSACFRSDDREALIKAARTIASRECADQIAHNEHMMAVYKEESWGENPEVVQSTDMPFFELRVGPWYVRVASEAPVLTDEGFRLFLQMRYDRSYT